MRGWQRGQGLAEYGLVLACVAIMAIIALSFMGAAVSQLLIDTANSLSGTPVPIVP